MYSVNKALFTQQHTAIIFEHLTFFMYFLYAVLLYSGVLKKQRWSIHHTILCALLTGFFKKCQNFSILYNLVIHSCSNMFISFEKVGYV